MEQYPIFNRYPVQSVVVMQCKYERKVENVENDLEHEELLKSLQSESQQIAAKQDEFKTEQKIMDYLYKQKIAALQSEQEQFALNKKHKNRASKQKKAGFHRKYSEMHSTNIGSTK
eukprot:TRINITY_DN2376_c0_g1_i1.p1 TRINITY_DN2376_c0_g1~~TRINITY_DN2376_c0_g1_i1.p1  ORF type:complete len:116 (-),score=10.74 TRINITY_DN2376_c0_g1_i1:228-575(-)